MFLHGTYCFTKLFIAYSELFTAFTLIFTRVFGYTVLRIYRGIYFCPNGKYLFTFSLGVFT